MAASNLFGIISAIKSETVHAFDCATYNMPAYSKGECDCGVAKVQEKPIAKEK